MGAGTPLPGTLHISQSPFGATFTASPPASPPTPGPNALHDTERTFGATYTPSSPVSPPSTSPSPLRDPSSLLMPRRHPTRARTAQPSPNPDPPPRPQNPPDVSPAASRATSPPDTSVACSSHIRTPALKNTGRRAPHTSPCFTLGTLSPQFPS